MLRYYIAACALVLSAQGCFIFPRQGPPAPVAKSASAKKADAADSANRALGLKPYGVFILSMWAVMTIAAIGLNLTLGYAGQVSLAQAAFVGIGAYITAWLTTKGWPFWPTYFLGESLVIDDNPTGLRQSSPKV